MFVVALFIAMLPRTVLDCFELVGLDHHSCCCHIEGDGCLHSLRERIGSIELREWVFAVVPFFAWAVLAPANLKGAGKASPLYTWVVDAVGGEEVLFGLIVTTVAAVFAGNVLIGCVCCCNCGFSLASMRAIPAAIGRITTVFVALLTTHAPVAFALLFGARAAYLWIYAHWNDATRERIARMRQRTNNYRVASVDDYASPTSRSERLERFHQSGAARATAKLRALAARLWGIATPHDGAVESRDEQARRQFCSGASSQCVSVACAPPLFCLLLVVLGICLASHTAIASQRSWRLPRTSPPRSPPPRASCTCSASAPYKVQPELERQSPQRCDGRGGTAPRLRRRWQRTGSAPERRWVILPRVMSPLL